MSGAPNPRRPVTLSVERVEAAVSARLVRQPVGPPAQLRGAGAALAGAVDGDPGVLGGGPAGIDAGLGDPPRALAEDGREVGGRVLQDHAAGAAGGPDVASGPH